MKFLNFIHLAIPTILLNYVAVEATKSDEQQQHCIAKRTRNNENSWNEWENLHSSLDTRTRANMTQRNLQSINRELLAKHSTVIIMDLSINRISAIENGTFERFHNLHMLLMRGNSLQEITASQFRGLMMLEELDLSANAIHTLERDALRLMERLRTINLSGNCLFTLRPYIFFRNVRLTNIYLNRNFLDTLPTLMPHSQRIDKLNVTENRFRNLTSLLYYENIVSLDVSHNPLNFKEISNTVTDAEEGSSSTSSSDEDNNYHTIRLNYHLNENSGGGRRNRRSDDFPPTIDSGRGRNNNGEPSRISEALINGSLKESNLIRNTRNSQQQHLRFSSQQVQQLQEFKRINRLEYFTCRNCSLHSLDFLQQFPKLKYVDVRGNMIKSVDGTRLAKLQHIEYLDVSNNNALESVSLNALLTAWPRLARLQLNDNRGLKCDLVRRMRTVVDHLNRVFRLDVNVCT